MTSIELNLPGRLCVTLTAGASRFGVRIRRKQVAS